MKQKVSTPQIHMKSLSVPATEDGKKYTSTDVTAHLPDGKKHLSVYCSQSEKPLFRTIIGVDPIVGLFPVPTAPCKELSEADFVVVIGDGVIPPGKPVIYLSEHPPHQGRMVKHVNTDPNVSLAAQMPEVRTFLRGYDLITTKEKVTAREYGEPLQRPPKPLPAADPEEAERRLLKAAKAAA